jgi:5,10-methylene-tetrahydrofolate dehydrogenase/methenyl tetrahydrofolate cyclohydrolase
LNSNDELDGYIVQLLLPKHIDEQKILMAIDPNKDDGFHPANLENGSRNGNVLPATLRNHAIIRTL